MDQLIATVCDIAKEAGGTILLNDASPVALSTDQDAVQTLLTTHSPQLHV